MILLGKSEKPDLRYIAGILNSKLINYYYKNYFITIDVLKNALLELPIAIVDDRKELRIVELVSKIEKLNKRLLQFKDKAIDEKVRLEKEIEKVDNQIDKEVFKIYGLSKEEIEIIEASI